MLAVLTMTDHVTPATLLALTFALGVGTALMGPAWQAIQPDLVPAREFGQAVALSSLTFNAGRAIGPALAGALVASAGAGWAFVVNAASFLGVVVVLVWWRPHRTSVRLSTESLPGAVRAGLRYGANAPALRGDPRAHARVRRRRRRPSRRCCRPSSATSSGMGSGGYGILLGCFGDRRRRSRRSLRPRIDAMLTSDQQRHGVLGRDRRRARAHRRASPRRGSPAPALFFAGAAWTTATVTLNVATQAALPWWVRARGLGLYLVVLAGGIAVGSALWGAIAGWSIAGRPPRSRRRSSSPASPRPGAGASAPSSDLDLRPATSTRADRHPRAGRPTPARCSSPSPYRVPPGRPRRVRRDDAAASSATAAAAAPSSGACTATSPTPTASSRRSRSTRGASTCASTSGARARPT